jgi:hypothetical protein
MNLKVRNNMAIRIIHKYEVPSDPKPFTLMLPPTATILDIQLQGDTPQMWVLKPAGEVPHVERKFIVIPTGFEFDEGLINHLGTFQYGKYVWHVFEILRV